MRELNPLIEKHIESHLGSHNGLPLGLMHAALKAMLGIQEEGDNRGSLVSAIQDTVGAPDHAAWCMSLQQTAIAFVEKKLSLKCDLLESEHCLTVFNEAKRRKQIVIKPEVGTLAIWQKGQSAQGHVGFVSAVYDYNRFASIEGNTGPGKGVEREGDGVYEKIRAYAPLTAAELHIVGFIRLGWVA